MRTFRSTSFALVLAAAIVAPTHAQQAVRDPLANPWVVQAGFLDDHPDWSYRIRAMKALEAGREREAFQYFRRAGLYADKPSQAMVAEMYWTGRGVARDRALAYAWMDLAAERGTASLVRLRERYWYRLTPEERNRAIEEGRAIHAVYADRVAQRRQERVMRAGRRDMVGTRTGFGGLTAQIVIPAETGRDVSATIDHAEYYRPEYWQAGHYWNYQERRWEAARTGVGLGGDLQPVENERDAAEPEQEPPAPSPAG